MSLKILIIDDDVEVTTQLQDIAVDLEHEATVENDSRKIEPLLSEAFDLIFLALRMPFVDGIQVMRMLSERKVSAALVLMSDFDESVLNTAHELAEAHQLNALGHVLKPLKRRKVDSLIQQVEEKNIAQIRQPASQRKMSTDDIRKAFDNDRIEVHYQPQMDVKMGRVVGLEALCRIRDKNNHLVYPDLFIDEVERLGLIHELTLAVAIIAAQDYAELSAQYPGMTISINISTRDLEELFFPDVLETIFNEHKINPGKVIIEVTEDIMLQSLEISLDVLARIRIKGFKISIDDFGKGASTLSNIKYFPATELKIHREFIQSIGEKDKSLVLVKHTMELAHQLGLDVVAQGVEDKDIADWLSSQGCDLIQGYWFSKPLSKPELLTFLKDVSAKGVEVDSTANDQDNTASLDGLKISTNSDNSGFKSNDVAEDNEIIISAILPLTGGFSFIGNSQLYGIKAALREYHDHKKASDIEIKLEVFDDQSSIERYMSIAKEQVSSRCLACLGGVFTLSNLRWFIQTVLAMEIAVIGPFSGSVLLRDTKWTNLFNIRPSYEDELSCIAEIIRNKSGTVLLVYPNNPLGKRSVTIFDKMLNTKSISYGSDNRSQKYLIEAINKSNANHVVFIGGTKTFADIINEVTITPVNFYSISMVGLVSLKRYVKKTHTNVFITSPIEDYQSMSPAAKQYRQNIKPFITDNTAKYRNSLSFEAYLNTLICLKGLEKCKSYSKGNLIQALETIQGADIGLSSPVNWDKDKRQFLNNVELLNDKVG